MEKDDTIKKILNNNNKYKAKKGKSINVNIKELIILLIYNIE